jgi:hypothetical protein
MVEDKAPNEPPAAKGKAVATNPEFVRVKTHPLSEEANKKVFTLVEELPNPTGSILKYDLSA